MPFSQKIKYFLVSIALAIIVIVVFFQRAGNSLSATQIRQLESDTRLKGIAQMVLAYESKHGGNMPRSLSELVPDGRTDLLSIFYAPNVTKSSKPVGWSTNKMILDKSSDYALPSHPNSDIVVFEKSGLWPDGTVAVCFTNLSVERMSSSNFEVLLNKDGNR